MLPLSIIRLTVREAAEAIAPAGRLKAVEAKVPVQG
jgi:hypothetical protein